MCVDGCGRFGDARWVRLGIGRLWVSEERTEHPESSSEWCVRDGDPRTRKCGGRQGKGWCVAVKTSFAHFIIFL